ncbi:PKD domain-containing protein [Halolamina sp. C58]|uniref:PKD domain-containing protein n=1 Tax=Halolamina sp. C58 TaxID=3421640 RepID=UPI003EB755C0
MLAVLLVVAGLPMPAVTAADDGRPLADAGLDQSATVGSTVYLDGGGSVDPDGEIVDYDWSIRTPSGERMTPADSDAVTTRFVPDEIGRYEVRLTVTGDDGQTHADTMYVDVEEAPEQQPTETPTETAIETPAETPAETLTETPAETLTETPAETLTETPAETPAETSAETLTETPRSTEPPEPTPTDAATSTPSPPDPPTTDPNQPPSGEIEGPSHVTSGSAVSYSIDATDSDGEIVDRWWLPTSLASSPPSQAELRSGTRAMTVDGTPGTTATVTAIVVDDDGATSTLQKTVEIRNTPPTARIEGDDVAVVDSTKEYRVVASDPDGQIVSVSLTDDAGAVEPAGTLSGGTGEWARSFRFTGIPERDGTVTIEATVRDEHGGVTKVKKEVTVVESEKSNMASPLAQSSPDILSLDLSVRDGPNGISGRQIILTGVANDTDSNRLHFQWKVDDRLLFSTHEGGSPARASVSHGLENMEFDDGTVEVQLMVTDQNGHQQSVKETFDVHRGTPSENSSGLDISIQLTDIDGTTVQGRYRIDSMHAGKQVVIGFGDKNVTTHTLEETNYHYFRHRYASGGDYHLSINPAWSPDKASIPVRLSEREYTVWEYERNTTEIYRTEAVESPGENWTKEGVARINREQIDTKTMRTPADDGRGTFSPGPEWQRVGTTTEFDIERRTTRSTNHPGGEWEIAKRNVDQQRVFAGWEYTIMPQRDAFGDDWEYVEAVPRTVERTETERSADRPAGSGWERGDQVGRTLTGYHTQWVYSHYRAPEHWEYRRSDRYVSGYDETEYCVERSYRFDPPVCIESETERDPVYDYQYEYRVPEYDAVYEWERTVEETEYSHRYRRETYEKEAVHEYEKQVRVGTEYIRWERPVFERTEVYRWQKITYTWEKDRAFSEPAGDVRNVTKIVRECGANPNANEPTVCNGET